jgi:hypothetical protein
MLEWNGDYFVNNNTFSSSINNSVSTLNTLTGSLATTGSNTFVGTQTLSGSIIPATDNTYDLGSATYQWRDIYVSSGSLYIDGTKVLGSTGNELQITTDVGQSIKILEAGSDSIILQSADGDIQLKTSGGGNLLFDPTTGLIDIRGTLQIQDGYKVTSSGGNAIQFGNDLGITGSINTTGNVNGINLTTFSSSIATTLLNQNTATSSYETKGRGIISGSSQLNNASIENLTVINLTTVNETASVIFSSGSNRFGDFGNDIHSFTGSVQISGSITTLGSSTATSFSGAIAATNGVVSGSSQITFSGISSLPTLVSGSSQITYANVSSIPAGIVSGSSQITYANVSSIPAGIVSGSSQVDVMSTTNIAKLATTGSNTFNANQIISGSLSILGPNATGTFFNAQNLGAGGATFTRVNASSYPYNHYIFNNGNVGIGITPQGAGTAITLEIGSRGMIYDNNDNVLYGNNGWVDAGTWKYKQSGAACILATNGGQFTFSTAASGIQNNAITWSDKFVIANNGNATLSGTFTENSSLRYKENVETIKYGLDKVLQMRGVTYDKKDNGVKEIGVIAEEVYEVLPEVVLKNEEGEIDSVSYGRITAVLIEAIKDLKKEIEDLKANR